MAIACTETSQASIADLRFKIAAFISFFGLIPMIIKLYSGLFLSFHPSNAFFNFIDTSLSIALLTGSIYILLQLKRLLVEKYHTHDMNNLINIIIILGIYIPAVIFLHRMGVLSANITGITGISLDYWIFFMPAILLAGIISIIFGKKLLEVKDLASGLYRIYAILSIIRGACLCTIILAPIIGLLSLVSTVVLGMIFLRESKAEPEIEFV